MCRLPNIAMPDYQESVTTGQTDRQTDGWTDGSSDPYVPLCFAIAGDTKTFINITNVINHPIWWKCEANFEITKSSPLRGKKGEILPGTRHLWLQCTLYIHLCLNALLVEFTMRQLTCCASTPVGLVSAECFSYCARRMWIYEHICLHTAESTRNAIHHITLK